MLLSGESRKKGKPKKVEAPTTPERTRVSSVRADPTLPDTGAHRVILEKAPKKPQVAKDKRQ